MAEDNLLVTGLVQFAARDAGRIAILSGIGPVGRLDDCRHGCSSRHVSPASSLTRAHPQRIPRGAHGVLMSRNA